MSRRMLKNCLWTAAVLAALGLASQSPAKPPDLPVNTDHTVTPDVLPDGEWDGVAPLPGDREVVEERQTGYVVPRPLEVLSDRLLPCGMPVMNGSTGVAVSGVAPISMVVRSASLPLLAHLPPVQRRQFASALLFGVHPLLTLMPTDKLVDMSCDHPGCVILGDGTVELPYGVVGVTGETVFCIGFNNAGLKCEIVPMPSGVHGTIEIGIGFSLNSAPTYKFRVTEFSGCGTIHKDETCRGCVEAFLRWLKEDTTAQPQPARGDAEESSRDGYEKPQSQPSCPDHRLPMPCPGWQPQQDLEFQAGLELSANVLEYLDTLRKGEELKAKGRRLAEDGFHDAARKCFEDCYRLCPGLLDDCDVAVTKGHVHDSLRVLCLPGVEVMVNGLLKACHLSLEAGRLDHAADLARQAYALNSDRVQADTVIYKLYQLSTIQTHPSGCCEDCRDCSDCPCCNKPKTSTAKPVKIIIPGGSFITPTLPAIDLQTVQTLEDVLKAAGGEEQEEPIFQKAIAKPYRETNDAPAGIGKGD